MYNPLHGVPLSSTSIQNIADHNYRTPSSVGNITFDIAADSHTWSPEEHKGALKLAGPMEPLHALWIAADRDIQANPEDTDLHGEWAKVFRGVGFRYVVISNDLDVFHHQENEKEKLITLGDAVTPSGLQKIMKIVNYKIRYLQKEQKDDIPNTELMRWLKSKISLSPKSEQFSADYVNHAISTFDNAISNTTILGLVSECQKMGTASPFAFISGMHIMATKSKVHPGLLLLFLLPRRPPPRRRRPPPPPPPASSSSSSSSSSSFPT
eukprot:4283727-Pyramimonas_sp.AAC.1